MTYSPAPRLLIALDVLQSRASISATQLAERLQVNSRSVRRYMMMLQDLGIPVEGVRGRYGGYRLRPGFKLPPLVLTEDEALAVTLGLMAARRMGLSSTVPAVEGALAKIERVLPVALRERVQAVQEMVTLDLGAAVAPSDAERVLLLSAAAYRQRCVWLRHQVPEGEVTERMIDPYGLVYHEGRWYVVGYCHLRQTMRVFRLDRIIQLEARDEAFTRPAGFDCLAYALHSFAAMPDRWLVEVLLETALEQVRWSVPPTFATLEETTEGVVLRAYAHDLDHTARFLMGLGCAYQVRRPPELLDALRQLAAEITRVVEQASERIGLLDTGRL